MSVDAIVLAGGRSRRFGSDKLAAPLDGGTVLAAVIDAVSQVADGVIVAGPALPDGFSAVSTRVMHLRDREQFQGPLVAVAASLEQRRAPAPEDLAIVVGGDMPRLVPAVLAAMLGMLQRAPTVNAVFLGRPDSVATSSLTPAGATATPPPRRAVLPLAVRHAPAARAARVAVDDGQRSLQALVDRLEAVELPASVWLELDPAAGTLVDVDTPEDLDRLRARSTEADRPR